MQRIGYVRTSKDTQYTDRQILALHKTCDKVYVEDGVSGRAKNRPVLKQVIKELNAGGELVVHAYDRAFRDVIDALLTLNDLTERKIKLTSLTQGFDPATAYGRFLFILIIAVAEFEINNLAERTKHGLIAARQRGSILGRPKAGEVRIPKRPKQEKHEPLELPGVIYGTG